MTLEGSPGPGRPLLALVGPTGSGKTEASLPIAEALDAEIVCVDSMLVYRGMDVGTAKPSPEARRGVRHHLVDLVDPSEPFSVARFQSMAAAAAGDILARGRRRFLVGGTGLYFRAVVDGLKFPGGDPGTRQLLEAEARLIGAHNLHGRLASFDPEAAGRIDPANARRTVRALEVAAATGLPFSSFYRGWDRYPPDSVRAAGVEMPREQLHSRIEERAEGMMGELLRETENLLGAGFGGFLTASQAIGYAEAMRCLEGSMTIEEAVAGIVRRTKALARRQMAWFRRDPRIRWFTVGEEGAISAAPEIIRYLARGGGQEGTGRTMAQAPSASSRARSTQEA